MSEIKLFKSKAYRGAVLAMLMASISLMSCGGGGGGGGDATAVPTAVGRVFFDDFESYSVATLPTTQWDQNGNRNLPEVVATGIDSGLPHGGSKMLQINWNGTVAFDNPDAYTSVVLPSWSYNKEFFIRMWWRLDIDFGTNCGGCAGPGEGVKFMRFNFLPSSAYGVIEIVGGSGATHEVYINPDTGELITNQWGVMDLFDYNWHKVEIYVYQDAVNGVVKRWTDGVLNYSVSGVDTTSAAGDKWYPLHLASNWSNNPGWQHSAANHFYVDNVEIFSDTGTGATGSMANATIKQ